MGAVIFDLDGVLIDSEPHWHAAEVEVFTGLGVPLTTEMCLETTGLRTDAMVEHWFERYPWTGPTREEVVRQIQQRVRELVVLHGRAIQGAVQLVGALRACVPLAVCSSSPLSLIEASCNTLGIFSDFRVLQSAEECVRGKPYPDPYLATAEKLGIAPERCVVIEDSLNGMKSARAAGTKVVGVTTDPAASAPGLCDLVRESIAELDPDAIKSLLPKKR